jgi:hypothetical protein
VVTCVAAQLFLESCDIALQLLILERKTIHLGGQAVFILLVYFFEIFVVILSAFKFLTKDNIL